MYSNDRCVERWYHQLMTCTYQKASVLEPTEPWGMLEALANTAVFSDLTAIYWVSSVMKDRSHSKATSWIPNTVRAQSIGVVWSMASNADGMSSTSRAMHWLFPVTLCAFLNCIAAIASISGLLRLGMYQISAPVPASVKSGCFWQIHPSLASAKFAARFAGFFNPPCSGYWKLKSNELWAVNVIHIVRCNVF